MREDTVHLESVFEVGGAREVQGESKERQVTGARKGRAGGQVAQGPVLALPWGAACL